jgi:SAM-dependent methyltransferase
MLPRRYYEDNDREIRCRFLPLLVPGARVLDVGPGRYPVVSAEERPDGLHYVGLDVSRDELGRAPKGSYDEIAIADATVRVPAFEGRFDLVLSRWVLEHVRPIDAALENFRSYLRPGGMMVAYLAGGRSFGSVANRLLGRRMATAVLSRFTYRSPDSVFPAEYDRCVHRRLVRMGEPWTRWEVLPIYENATLLSFAPPLQALYVAYEEMLVRHDLRNLATHYVIIGEA